MTSPARVLNQNYYVKATSSQDKLRQVPTQNKL